MRALQLSPTSIKTYTRCPYAYGLDKIARIPRYKRVIAPELHTGRSVHTVLEHLVKQPEVSRADAERSLDETFAWHVYDDPTTAQAAYQTARERLSDWVNFPYGWGDGQTLAVEKLLRTPNRDGLVLLGKPDLVREHPNGSLEVVDHKSGRFVPSLAELKMDYQAGIYRLLAEQYWPGYPHYQVSFSYLATGAVVPVAYTATEIEHWWTVLSRIGERIGRARASVVEGDIPLPEAFPPKPGEQCERCPFRKVCTFSDAHRRNED